MISINQNIISKILNVNSCEINKLIANSKQSVIEFNNKPDKSGGRNKPRINISLNQNQYNYLEYLISNFEDIVLAKPKSLQSHKINFDNIITATDLAENKNKEFRDELIKRMGYSTLRDRYYANYFNSTGLKACTYCNSQLAVTVRTDKNKKSAKFQVDHFLPKSQYPCFSVSFFNLIPVCGPCNGKKNDNAVDFIIYSDDYNDLKDSPFKFRLDKKSIISYRVNGNTDNLKIIFDDPLNKGFNESFDIEGIYSTQKDLAEELVLKSIIYNKSYLNSLKNSFKKLYPDKIPMAERLLVGNYTNAKDIHKRPMAKFTQDIAKQLKLI